MPGQGRNLTETELMFPPGGVKTFQDSGAATRGLSTPIYAIKIQKETAFTSVSVTFDDGTTGDLITLNWGWDNPQQPGDFLYVGDGAVITDYAIDANGGQVQELYP